MATKKTDTKNKTAPKKAAPKAATTKAKTTKAKATQPKTEKISNKDMMPKIKVIGIGGSGKNAVNYMVKHDVRGVKFVAINTDAQDLDQSKATKKLHIGKDLTAGAGTGMNPSVGKEAALESKEDITKVLEDTSIVFITGGMGGGTGTGASPVVAQIAKEMGILTVAVVTKPFSFEGAKRMTLAKSGIEELGQYVDAYIVIPNDKILEVADENATMGDAFSLSDDVLLQAVTGISNLITTPGRINIDASDVRTVLENQGLSLVGIGSATGDTRAEEAASRAINSPLLDISVKGAKSVLFSITAGDDLKMSEVAKIAETITKEIDPEATVKFGTIRDLKLKKGEVRVTVVASGFSGEQQASAPAPSTHAKVESAEDDIFKDLEYGMPNSVNHGSTTNKVLSLKDKWIASDDKKDKEKDNHKKDETSKKEAPKEAKKVETNNKADTHEDDGEDFWSLPAFLKK